MKFLAVFHLKPQVRGLPVFCFAEETRHMIIASLAEVIFISFR